MPHGTTIECQVSECHISLPQGEGHTPVILGEVGDEALLGVVTLENPWVCAEPLHPQIAADENAPCLMRLDFRPYSSIS